MVFASPIFLIIFLPIVLGVYFVLHSKYRNAWLCFASFVFYSWSGLAFALILFISTIVNFILGILISKTFDKKKKIVLVVAILYNLSILAFFKYFNFIVDNITLLIKIFIPDFTMAPPLIPLPVGISFFTFQILSYIIDVYKNNVKVQRNIINLGLYIMLFPQLIAGPIVRYIDIEQEIAKRSIDIVRFREGLERFIIGLAKKVLIANAMGEIADFAFNNPAGLTSPIAWLGIAAYTLQIYFDFSAYSDMAIGLGHMFGFTFRENFNYPYISKSIQEFWRRWHISLSSWFRDYLYIPLGGNRNGTIQTYRNLLVVFFLTGLWHGASWNFILWGLFHGMFLIFERLGLSKFLARIPAVFGHVYVILVVMIGWVLFRAKDISSAILYLKKMFSFDFSGMERIFLFMDNRLYIGLLLAIVFSTPLFKIFEEKIALITVKHNPKGALILLGFDLYIFILFIVSLSFLTGSKFNPFIYFQF